MGCADDGGLPARAVWLEARAPLRTAARAASSAVAVLDRPRAADQIDDGRDQEEVRSVRRTFIILVSNAQLARAQLGCAVANSDSKMRHVQQVSI